MSGCDRSINSINCLTFSNRNIFFICRYLNVVSTTVHFVPFQWADLIRVYDFGHFNNFGLWLALKPGDQCYKTIKEPLSTNFHRERKLQQCHFIWALSCWHCYDRYLHLKRLNSVKAPYWRTPFCIPIDCGCEVLEWSPVLICLDVNFYKYWCLTCSSIYLRKFANPSVTIITWISFCNWHPQPIFSTACGIRKCFSVLIPSLPLPSRMKKCFWGVGIK